MKTRNSFNKNIVLPVYYKKKMPYILSDKTLDEFNLKTKEGFFEKQYHKYDHIKQNKSLAVQINKINDQQMLKR